MPHFTFLPPTETSEISEDIRRLFEDLAASLRHEQRAYSGECHPAIDVLETDQSVLIVVDIPGVPKAALRVLFRAGVIVVAGEKAPPTGDDTQRSSVPTSRPPATSRGTPPGYSSARRRSVAESGTSSRDCG